MKNKQLILAARFLSALFRPFYMPIMGFFALFTCTYLNLLPISYKLTVILLVYCFTVLLPQLSIFLYRKINGWKSHHLGHREKRIVPYILSIISYLSCLYVMNEWHMPRYMGGIIVAALLGQIVCAVINIWWKISVHSAGAGAVIGGLLAFSLLFMFNPVWWLCLAVLLAGAVNSSRIILRQHTLAQVSAGTIVGILCGFLGILLP